MSFPVKLLNLLKDSLLMVFFKIKHNAYEMHLNNVQKQVHDRCSDINEVNLKMQFYE